MLWSARGRQAMLLVLCAILCLAGATGCRPKRALIVGTEATFKPFEFRDEKNQLVGFDVDLAKAIAKELKRPVQFQDMPFDGLIGALNAKQVDLIIAGMTITAERAQRVAFTEPYYDASQVIVTRATDNRIKSRDDLIGLTIAVQMGTTGADAAEEIPGATVVQFRKANEAFMEVQTNRADAVIIDEPVARAYVAKLGGLKVASEPFTEERYGIAVRKEDAELAEQINAALRKLKASGEYDRIYQRWFPD